eukprot:7932487-Heterocapsa_arctica.AAC.1
MTWAKAAAWIVQAVRYTGTSAASGITIAPGAEADGLLPTLETTDVWSRTVPGACAECTQAGAAQTRTTPGLPRSASSRGQPPTAPRITSLASLPCQPGQRIATLLSIHATAAWPLAGHQ